MRRTAATILLAGLIATAPAAPAAGYVLEGQPWPTTTLGYYVRAAGYRKAVDAAARDWSRAHVGIRFTRVPLSQAQIVLRYGGAACNGEATVGYEPGQTADVTLGRGCSQGVITLTAVHELGHVLGLGHENHVCARMNPFFSGGTPNHCPRHSLSYWLRHPLRHDDAQGVRALY
jgi:hypothetical protein